MDQVQTKNSKKVNKILNFTEHIALIICIGAIIVLRIFFFAPVKVSGASMQPSFTDGSYVFLSKVAYEGGYSPCKDDVVVASEPGDGMRVIKRIVAVPGDTVDYNGQQIVLGKNEYFIEGDNRNDSEDSRMYGPVNITDIAGKVIIGIVPKDGHLTLWKC